MFDLRIALILYNHKDDVIRVLYRANELTYMFMSNVTGSEVEEFFSWYPTIHFINDYENESIDVDDENEQFLEFYLSTRHFVCV